MYSSLTPVQSEGNEGVKGYACLTCRQRKVKCDRLNPCNNCVKASKECSFIAPVRGKRKRSKPTREGLHARLERYEELLKSFGAKNELSEHSDDSELDTTSPSVPYISSKVITPCSRQSTYNETAKGEPKLVNKEGTSRYFDNAVWNSLGDGFHHPEMAAPDEEGEVPTMGESELIFDSGANLQAQNLISLHPPLPILHKLKEIYLDRVDPLMKILHMPTFWTSVIDGYSHLGNLPKSQQAVMFAFYFAVITTMTEAESQRLFGTQKSVLQSRYGPAARRALLDAGFISTSSPTTLTAYAIFMMCMRNVYGCDALFVLSGIAVRLARKMGFHRDGKTLGLSPFETEMRRRIWWHLVHVDFRTSDVLGTRPTLDLADGDVGIPINVEDLDLIPDMTELPAVQNGITSATLCVIRCETLEALRRFSTTHPNEWRWEALFDTNITLEDKDKFIDRLEDHMESKYLRYCDPSKPFHTFVSVMSRSAICKMRLFAHNPRHFANNSNKVSQRERDIVFANATKLLDYVALLQSDRLGLEKYLWQIGTSYLWNTMLYVLIEARHRKRGPEVDRVWELIGLVFSYYPQVFQETTGPVYAALGRWTLEVWDDYVAASTADNLPAPISPDYIDAIRRCRRPIKPLRSSINNTTTDPTMVDSSSFVSNNAMQQGFEDGMSGFESFDTYQFPDLPSFEMDPNEWTQWEQLIADQGGFARVNGV